MPSLSAKAQFTPRNSLGRFTEVVIRPGVRESVQASVDTIRDAAQHYAPVRTGALRDSIQGQVDDTARTVVGRVTVGVAYGFFVEYGTGKLGDPAVPHNPDWPGMEAQPYMRPAVDENRAGIVDLFRANISLSI